MSASEPFTICSGDPIPKMREIGTLIYFSPEDQRDVIAAFATRLRPRGILILGHSENVPAGADSFERLPKTVFRRKA